jgi:hypothetical protein
MRCRLPAKSGLVRRLLDRQKIDDLAVAIVKCLTTMGRSTPLVSRTFTPQHACK